MTHRELRPRKSAGSESEDEVAMIDGGDVVAILGDLRLWVRIEAGRVVDAWTVNDLGAESRDADELRWAFDRADGAAMYLRGVPGMRQRELSGHERMAVLRAMVRWAGAIPGVR